MSKQPATLRLLGLDYSVVQQCMHCGMCLPTCPTYDETKLERNSPRGRIAWMRAIADGEMKVDQAFSDEMYYCLGCLACTTACPAGVDYATLFEAARADVEATGAAGGGQRSFWRWLTIQTIFMHPRLLRLSGRILWLYQVSGLAAGFRRVGFLGLLPRKLRELEVTYHESCHLCHGQKVRHQPRGILDAIPGLRRLDLPESDWCCGSAGIYNITQPAQAAKLAERKVAHIRSTGAPIVATANPGCHLQLENGLRTPGSPVEVKHPISLLAEAYRKEAALSTGPTR